MWCAVPAALCDAGAVVAFVCVHVRSHVGVLSTDRPLLRRLRVCAGHWRCTGKHGGGVTSSGVAGVRGWAVRVRRWRCAAVVAPGRGGRWFPAAGAGTTRAVCAADAPTAVVATTSRCCAAIGDGRGQVGVCAMLFSVRCTLGAASCMTSPSDVPPPGITCTCTESKTDTRMLSSMCDVFVGNAYNAVKKFREAKTAAGAGGEEASGAEDGASATALITSNSHQRRAPPLVDYTSRNISEVLDAVLSTTCGLHSSHLSEIVKGVAPARTLCGLVNVYLSFSARLPADTQTAGQPTDTSPDTARVPWWCDPLFEGGRCAQPAATPDGACARVVRTWSKTVDIIHCLEVLYRALAYYTGPLAARALLAPDSTNSAAAFAALQKTWVHTVGAIKSSADSEQQDEAKVCPTLKEQLKKVLVGPRCANCGAWAWWRPACHSTCTACSLPVTVKPGALMLPPLSLHCGGNE